MSLTQQLQHKIDHKTKPVGSLGKIEKLALQIGQVQNSLELKLKKPHMLIFGADHGVAQHGVSAFPQDVTWQMLYNFMNGGAAINVFCRQNDIELKVVDAGINHDFPEDVDIIHAKVKKGTHAFHIGPAMSIEDCKLAMDRGRAIVKGLHHKGVNVLGFGEMGIGNTTSSAALMAKVTGIAVEDCTGRGTGIDNTRLEHKQDIIKTALELHKDVTEPTEVLAALGGFEIAMMTGAMLEAFEHNMLIIVDGFISSAAYLMTYSINKTIHQNAIFSHVSHESGHAKLLEYLDADALLQLDLRLGEGTGAALAYPLIQAAVNFMNEMASFESAAVSQKD